MRAKNVIMSKCITILAFVIFALNNSSSYSQEYKKMFTDGKKWVYEETMFAPPKHPDHEQRWIEEVVGDTVYNSKPAKIVLVKHSYVSQKYDINDYYEYKYVAWEENGISYVGDKMICNMNLTDGDSFYNHDVKSVDYVDTDLGKLKRIHFQDLVYRYPRALVEGIGYSNDMMLGYDDPIGGSFIELKECYDNGKLIFTTADFTSALREIDAEMETAPESVDPNQMMYDIMGMQVKNPQSGALVIQNHKKYVVK